MAGNGRLRLRPGREGSSLLRMVAAPGAGCASCHDIRFKWFATAAGPRLRTFMFSTIVLQNRGVCSCWEFQGASQYEGRLLTFSEGAGCSAVDRTVIHAVDMMEAVDGSGPGGVFIHENRANCGSTLPTGNLHLSPLGPVLRQAWEPNAIPGTRSPRLGCTPTREWLAGAFSFPYNGASGQADSAPLSGTSADGPECPATSTTAVFTCAHAERLC